MNNIIDQTMGICISINQQFIIKNQNMLDLMIGNLIQIKGNKIQKDWYQTYRTNFTSDNLYPPVIYELLNYPYPSVPEYNFNKITDNIYVGSDILLTCDLGDTFLKSLGITHIIDLRQNSDYIHNDKYIYKNYKWNDKTSFNIIEDGNLYEIIDYLENLVNSDFRIYINCRFGVSRSITLCIAYFMIKKNMTFTEAYLYTKKMRKKANPNYGFIWQLIKLHIEKHPLEKIILQMIDILPDYFKNTYISYEMKKEFVELYIQENPDGGNYDDFNKMCSKYINKNV